MSPATNGQQDEYDFIICGGGTSGCVVAGRLAEDTNTKILLIEAGAHNKDLENVHMVGGWSQNFDTDNDWKLVSEPMKGVNGRQVKLSRGRFLGGSSGVNGTLVVKGTKQDYDDWELPGWSGEEVFEYMRKAENFHNKPWFKPDEKTPHGNSGHLHTEPHDLAPISKLVLESMEAKGLPLIPDLCSSGNCAHGSGHAARTHHKGIRTTGADFVTNDQHKDNIEILTNMTVDKINLEKAQDGQLRAASVSVIDSDGKSTSIKARKEIILSAGAYCSPPLLMRSGIGPSAELNKHNIPVLVDSPGVGQNLLDHLITFTFYEVNKPGITNDHLVYHGDAAMAAFKLYKEQKSGILSTFPFGAFGFARLDERLQDSKLWQEASRKAGRDPMDLTSSQPHIEFFTTELYGGPKQYDDFPIDHKHAFAMITELFSPRSKGTVTLASASPHDNPKIDHNYLADPLDMLVMTEGVKLGNEIVTQGPATADLIKAPGRQICSIISSRTGSRTCRMGKDGDKDAVLDAELKVRGVGGLRVADCSVMPALHSGHTQMPAYAIGEKCADLLKQGSLCELEASAGLRLQLRPRPPKPLDTLNHTASLILILYHFAHMRGCLGLARKLLLVVKPAKVDLKSRSLCSFSREATIAMTASKDENENRLPRGLYHDAVTQFDALALNGKLIHGPYSTTIHDEDGFKIAFQHAPHLNTKPVLPADAPERKANNAKSNPFANPDPSFTLSAPLVGPAHMLMLNKFCVYRPSLLLVTRAYAPQSRALDAADLRACWAVLRRLEMERPDVKWTAIYNCGAESGSSQGHKHMQILPHPRVEEGGGVFALFPDLATETEVIAEGLAGVRHRHFVLRLAGDVGVEGLIRAHERLLARMREAVLAGEGRNGDHGGGDRVSDLPHNVIMTTDWICLIPRRHSGTERRTPANAFGMVGVVWTTRTTEADRWIEESGSIKEHLAYLGYPNR